MALVKCLFKERVLNMKFAHFCVKTICGVASRINYFTQRQMWPKIQYKFSKQE